MQIALQCRACEKFSEDQPHLIQCEMLSENEVTENLPKYDDIFSEDVNQLAKIGRLLKAKHEKLKQFIKQNQANAPSMSAAVSSTVRDNCNNDCIGIK